MSKHLEPDPEHLNPEQQEWFDNLASQGAHEYVVQLESENAALRDQLAQAKKFVGPCVSCGHNNYDAERKECAQRWMEGRYSVVCGCLCAKHNSLVNAATRMRDACVARVNGLTEPHRLSLRFGTGATGQRARAVIRFSNEVMEALQSLTYKPFQYGTMVSMTVAERDALCQTVRALQSELGQRERTMKFWEDSYLAEHEYWGNCKWKIENAALRDQLAQAKRCHVDAEEDLASARLRIDELQSRLAQVEKGRSINLCGDVSHCATCAEAKDFKP